MLLLLLFVQVRDFAQPDSGMRLIRALQGKNSFASVSIHLLVWEEEYF